MGTFAVILPAAGQSRRFGETHQKKIYTELDGRAIWLRAVEPFVSRPDVGQIILAIAPEDRELFEQRYHSHAALMDIDVIEGGPQRYETVARAIERVRDHCQFIAIHDAARPCLRSPLVDLVFDAAREHGAALPGLPVTDTLKRVNDERSIVETVPRAGLFAVQTPQAFRRDLIEQAYQRRDQLSAAITDDAQLVEALGHPVKIVDGCRYNLKITTIEDLALASFFMRQIETTEHPDRDAAPPYGTDPSP